MPEMLPRPAIGLVGVSKRFGTHVAVDDVTLEIGEGEFFSLLGPSGCGKTTTLRMVAGFELPDAGRIVLKGNDVTEVPANRRPVNMVFQQYALFPHMSVYDNVAFGLKVKRVPRAEHSERVQEMLRVVSLEGLDRRRARQLSGGQQQRVALARALVNRPAALLLDEPLGALDVKLRKQMQLELKRIQSTLGTTFVYVTHDQEEALAMSDRIAVMNRGCVEQTGDPREIYDRPRTAFVADFIGSLNAFDLRIDELVGERAGMRLAGGRRGEPALLVDLERGEAPLRDPPSDLCGDDHREREDEDDHRDGDHLRKLARKAQRGVEIDRERDPRTNDERRHCVLVERCRKSDQAGRNDRRQHQRPTDRAEGPEAARAEVERRLVERDVDLVEAWHEDEDRVGQADDDVPDHHRQERARHPERVKEK